MSNMTVVLKRNGTKENVKFDKILNRIQRASKGLSKDVNVVKIAQEVISRITDNISTKELDEFASEIAASYSTEDVDYAKLAGRIAVSSMHKDIDLTFSRNVLKIQNILREASVKESGKTLDHFTTEFLEFVTENARDLDYLIDNERDYYLDYFSFKTFRGVYATKIEENQGKKIIPLETPQQMWMRVSVALHMNNEHKALEERLKDIKKSYDLMSQKMFTHATPTLLNAGTSIGQLSSCFLLTIREDSIKGIYETITQTALISRSGGGIGVNISDVRAKGSKIRGTNGKSDGILPMLKVFNDTATYVNQAGKRKGAFAFYLEPWHADIMSFLDVKKNRGKEELRARDIFTALWVPDIFMRRLKEQVETDTEVMWSLMCPDMCPGLTEVYGEEFDKLYEGYETEGRFVKQVPVLSIWKAVMDSQLETGVPYIAYKDKANEKSNQKNLGVIKGSNLCVSQGTKILVRNKANNMEMINDSEIESFENQRVEIWNGFEWSEVTVKKTSDRSKLIRIHVTMNKYFDDNGNKQYQDTDQKFLDCTEQHKFYLCGNADDSEAKVVEAQNLKVGDKLESWTEPSGVTVEAVITEIEDFNVLGKTFCFAEPIRNKGMFNGIVTGQCIEILEYTSVDEVAVCNLASINLQQFVVNEDKRKRPYFDFEAFGETVEFIVENLNRVIDVTVYPLEEAKSSNLKNRPVALGVQGFADALFKLKMPYESQESFDLNRQVFEALYYHALKSSNRIAKTLGAYDSFEGSPASQGKLQFDLWGVNPSKDFDWDDLKKSIKKDGLRNSLLVACMPTATSSLLFGSTESFEPLTSNVYVRKLLSGDTVVVNEHLLKELKDLGLWSPEMKSELIKNEGSVQNLDVPDHVKNLFKTAFEVKQMNVLRMAADRGPFICQTQSMNIHLTNPTYSQLTSVQLMAWRLGLKTGMYYLRRLTDAKTRKFTEHSTNPNLTIELPEACSINDSDCLTCSS